MVLAMKCHHEWAVDIGAREPTARCSCGAWRSMDVETGQMGTIHNPHKPKKEVLMSNPTPRTHATATRAKELQPARKRAEELFRQGKSTIEVLDLLEPAWGRLAASTVAGWKCRMPPITHQPTPDAPVSLPSRDGMPRGLKVLLDMLPVAEEKRQCWLEAFNAMWGLVYGQR